VASEVVEVGWAQRPVGGAGEKPGDLGAERVVDAGGAAGRIGGSGGGGVAGLREEERVGVQSERPGGADGGRAERAERLGGGLDRVLGAADDLAIGDDRRPPEIAQAGQGGGISVEHAAGTYRWPLVRHA
jgi:hypothetical protein